MRQNRHLKNKKVLITGATGFIGANLVRRSLREGANVCVFTRKTSNKWRIKDVLKDLHEEYVDLMNYDAVKKAVFKFKPEVIFHTATYGGYIYQNDENKIISTNINGTVNLVTACMGVGFEAFVNTGSSSEYGIKNEPMQEGDLLVPFNVYGVSKAAATLFCQAKALSCNMPIVTLRLFSPYGYYDEPSRLISSIILGCLSGEAIELSLSSSVRDFVFIEDVLDAYLKTVEKSKYVTGEVFNIGYGRERTVGAVVNKVMSLTMSNAKPIYNAKSNPRTEPKRWKADISKSKQMLNWVPKFDLTNGVQKSIDWFKENISLYNV